MKIAILEDNIYFQEKIKGMINLNKHIVHTYTDVDSYNLSNVYYDLLFLDIHLHNENGIEYIKKHENKQLFIIYVSNHEECMINVFDTNVLGFIPKKDIESMIDEKIKLVEFKIQNMNRVSLSIVGGTVTIKEDDIVTVYLSEGNVYVTLENGIKYRLVYETLKEVQKNLSSQFIRVNNSNVVNEMKIKKLDNINHSIYLSNDEQVQVSRRKWVNLKRRYIKNKMNI